MPGNMKMKSFKSISPNKIQNDSKIAIIGGGPAGVFFALHLKKFAEEKGISPEITIFEQRNFNELGVKGLKVALEYWL